MELLLFKIILVIFLLLIPWITGIICIVSVIIGMFIKRNQ